MARPLVSSTTEEAYASLGPWTAPDETQNWALLHFVAALTNQLHELNDLVRDGDEGPGWSKAVDVDRAPAAYLPWLSQFAGVDLPAGLSEDVQRQALKSTSGFRRGTPVALAGAAQKYLTGQKVVQIIERDGGPYRFTVRTFGYETPNPQKVEAELIKAKPAGLLMTYEVAVGQTYGELTDLGDNYSELSDRYVTYYDMTTSVPPVV